MELTGHKSASRPELERNPKSKLQTLDPGLARVELRWRPDCIYMYIYVYVYELCTYLCICVCKYMYIYIHYIHIYIYVYIWPLRAPLPSPQSKFEGAPNEKESRRGAWEEGGGGEHLSSILPRCAVMRAGRGGRVTLN